MQSNATPFVPTRELAAKVLATVDAGLSAGLGKPIPGQMCVEAAVCFAMGLPHSDDPGCVAQSVRELKINLNDRPWSSKQARAEGMRRLAIIQLGTKDTLNEAEFTKRLAEASIRKIVPKALRAALTLFKAGSSQREALEEAAKRCETEGTKDAARAAADAARAAADAAAYAADAAADAADAAAYDKALGEFAEIVVQILIEMGAPAAQFLDLAPL